MKPFRTKVSYYDNVLATPMLICLPVGSFLLALGFGTESGVCAIIGIILLALFVILKIANWAVAKNDQNQALDEIYEKIESDYNYLLSRGASSGIAKFTLLKIFVEKYEKGEIDAETYLKFKKFIEKKL